MAQSACRATAALAIFLICPGVHTEVQKALPAPNVAGRAVEVQMRNVMYHFTDTIAVHIRQLHGQLVPTKGDLPVFDDRESFTLQIGSAEIAMSPDSLSTVLNSYVFVKKEAPLKDISIRIETGGQLNIKGKLHSTTNIDFETEGRLSATSDGKIRLHTEKVKALHVPVKGLMDLLGVKLADLIKNGKVGGVQAEQDDLILDAQTLLPPPHIVGQVTAVRLEPDNIVQIFGPTGLTTSPMRVPARNYMAYRGNRLRFGKLTMADTDMVLIDMDPKDPFDFYLDHYVEQLVAGYTKETPNFGLRVFMRDYNKLRQKKSGERSRGSATR